MHLPEFELYKPGQTNNFVSNIKYLLIIFILSAIFFAGCNMKKEFLISGNTMGTTYHIKVIAWPFKNITSLKKRIDLKLDSINKSMSTYRKDSEISKFNKQQDINKKFYITDDFMQVMLVAEKLYQMTQGAWDGTLQPLVNLWGFGSKQRDNKIPEKSEIKKVLSHIGFENIQITGNNYLMKKKPCISLDLASIAKGFAVDQIAKLIENDNIYDYVVEIGGETYASGVKKKGNYWKVGINMPNKAALFDQVYKIIKLHNKALATSGDYRIFFEKNGQRFCHILDYKTGYPVSNGVISASVIADTCTFADGLATALMVLGHHKGIELVNRLNNVECFIIVQGKNSSLLNYSSKGFPLLKQ